MAESKGAMLLERTLRMERMAAALQTQVQAELSATTGALSDALRSRCVRTC